MFGKFFASTFTGSMFGAGPDVFAVWGYVVAHAIDSTVELNPSLLAAILGASPERIEQAIARLCEPDPRSRNPAREGRRLVHEGGFQYHVTSHARYRLIRNDEERRAYNREKQRESRARINVKRNVNDSQSLSTMSAHTEAEAEAETDRRSEQTRSPVVGENKDTSPAPDGAGIPGGAPHAQEAQDGQSGNGESFPRPAETPRRKARRRQDATTSEDVRAVWDHWCMVMDHPRSILDHGRAEKIRARLAEGRTVAELCAALRGYRRHPYHRGDNESRTVYDALDLVCRNSAKVEAGLAYLEAFRLAVRERRYFEREGRWWAEAACRARAGELIDLGPPSAEWNGGTPIPLDGETRPELRAVPGG